MKFVIITKTYLVEADSYEHANAQVEAGEVRPYATDYEAGDKIVLRGTGYALEAAQ